MAQPKKTPKLQEKAAIGPYSFKEVEESVLDFWAKKKIYPKAKKLAAQRAKKAKLKPFYFLDGPPYTSGKVHIGTAWNKVLKDSVLRYKRMQGIDAWDRAGYDMHGLPTEHATEKKLGIKNKDEILKLGIGKFVEECRKLSVENMLMMNKDFGRLGVWMDFENAYQSIKDDFIEGEWWLIKKAHENKRLYQGKKTMHWCASCETALAKHELEYNEITDTSIFFKFKIAGSDKKFADEYLIVWTTTPWTLAFNLAVMVNPEMEYARCEVDGDKGREIWIIAKALAGPVVQAVADKKLRIIGEVMGEELKGIRYAHPWADEIPSMKDLKGKNDKIHTVVLSTEYVDISAGSGLVHCAPGCGPEDYEIGHREGLPAYNEINEEGVFPASMGRFRGLVAKKDDARFIEALEEKRVLIAKTDVEHDYAHCWRCHNPVVFRTTNQWFFKIEDLKENMKELNRDICWVPDWAGNRQFHSWLDNLRDNSITKQRFWGCPLPIWICGSYWEGKGKDDPKEKGCGNYVVVGSKAELRKLAGKLPEDLHKPYIDEITIKCGKCGKHMKRVPDILDVWVDAGCTSWICLDYPKNKELFEKMFPADFILEGKDQIRGWFNLLFVASMVSMEKPSFKAVYMHGWVNDSQGRKMSKSLGNYILPEEVINKYGADAFRYYSIGGANAGLDLNYNFEDVKLKNKNLSVFWNLHKLLLDMRHQGIKLPKSPKLSVEERYMLSKMNSTIKKATEKFERHNLDEIPSIVEELFLELSRTYIQLVRDKSSVGDDDEKEAVFYVLQKAIVASLKLLAPIAPFITERIYQNIKDDLRLDEQSVHHLEWPRADEKMIDEKLEKDFEMIKSVMQSILAAREKAQLGVRWPLKEAIVVTKNDDAAKAVESLKELVKVQTNVKEVIVKTSEPRIKKKARADYKKIGPEFGEDSAKLIAQFTMMPTDALLKQIEMNGHYIFRVDGREFKITKDHLIMDMEVPNNLVPAEFRFGELYIDVTRTEELEAEGYAREIMRRVQQLRKEAGLKKPDRIRLCIKVEEVLVGMLSKFKSMMKEKVGADEIRIVSEERLKEYQVNKEEKIKGKSVKIGFDRV